MGGLLRSIVVALATSAALGREGIRKDFPQQTHNPLQLYAAHAAKTALDNGLTLAVNGTTLEASGQWFEVSWSGVTQPSYDDMVVLYVPADAHISETAPAKFKWAARNDSHIRTGSGTFRFRLINMRADMRFAFVRNGLESPVIVATSAIIRVARPNKPAAVHLALTANQGEMLAQWVTRDAQSPVVRWGPTPGRYDGGTALGSSRTYTRDDLCGGIANSSGWIDPGALHTALMTGLEPGTRYYYVVGDEGGEESAELSFVSPPATGPHSTARFFALADWGQAEPDGSNEMTEMVASLQTLSLLQDTRHSEGRHLIVHNGDISYALGFVSSWDVFFDLVQPLASSMPYMTTPGNHERNWPGTGDLFDGSEQPVMDSAGECGVPYERRLAMPKPAGGGGEDELWYSFDFGPVHFLQYSTEHPFGPGTKQYSFVMSDLKSVNRSRTPWLVVGGHRPFYIDSTWQHSPDGDQDVAAALRDAFEDAFLEAGVDVTWHGHHHSYQRTCATYRGKCVPPREDGSQAAPVHMVIGHAGAGLTFNVKNEAPEIFEVVRVEHGFLKVDANATHFHCQVIRASDDSLMDELMLTKPPPPTATNTAAANTGTAASSMGGSASAAAVAAAAA